MHGVGPFLAAQETGGSVFTDGGARIYLLLNVLRLGQGYTGETLFPVAGSLAVLGALACALRRRWLLPAWWAVILVMDARAFATYATLPVAMLAGIGLADVLLPALRGLVGPWNARPITLRDLTAGRAALILGGGVLLASLAAASNDDHLGGENVFLVPLSPDERAAMRWVAAETPPDSRFLLVTAGVWPADKQSEWFPVLARRPSVATVQGYEWVPGGAFARLVEAYDEVQTGGCSATDSACLDRWSAEHGIAFTHVYVPNTPRGQCCDRLRRSLANDSRYVTLMDGPGAAIFARRDTAEPPVVACARDGAPSGRDPADTTRLTAGRAGSFLAAGC